MNFDQLLHSFKTAPLEIRRYVPDKFAKKAMIEAIPYLGEVLIDTEQETIVRIECAEALGKLGDKKGNTYLIKSMNDESEELRRTIVWAMGKISDPNLYSSVQRMIEDQSELVIKWAIKALSQLPGDIDQSLKYLYDMFDSYSDTNIRVETIRLVIKHAKNADERWFQLAYKLIVENKDDNLIISSFQLLSTTVGVGFMKNKIEFMKNYFEKISQNPAIRYSYFKLMALLDQQSFIKQVYSSNDTEHISKALFNEIAYLEGLLQQVDDENIVHILNAIAMNDQIDQLNFDLQQYLEHSNLSIKIAALRIHSTMNGPFDVIKNAYTIGKGKGSIIPLLGKYEKGLDILMKEAINGDKTCRVAAIRALITKLPDKKIREILEIVQKTERIWHLRRETRIALQN